MKAAVRSQYGLPGDLTIKELDIPAPKEDEVLITVYATTVNRSDCHVLSGKPFFMRFLRDYSNHGHPISGLTLREKLQQQVPMSGHLKRAKRS
jgi:NADPH:quinone reductase-like Zn-dependent oxidoreductase